MPLLQQTHLHYRTVFDIVPSPVSKHSWCDLIGAVGNWLEYKTHENRAFQKGWFLRSGEWSSPDSKLHVRTEIAMGKSASDGPEHWAMQFDEPDREVAVRKWRTEVGVSIIEAKRFRFCLTTTHTIMPNYLGEDPPMPTPTTPHLVKSILDDGFWRGFAGTERLMTLPVPVRPGTANRLKARLEDPERRCPLVYVSRTSQSQQLLMNVPMLAKLLAGNAMVYYAESPDLDTEMEYLIPKQFHCRNGMVRVYQPQVKFEEINDFKRHRFFTARDITEYSAANVEMMLVKGLVRGSRLWLAPQVTCVTDAKSKQRQERFTQLLKHFEGQPERAKEFKELEEFANGVIKDNDSLRAELNDGAQARQALEDDKQNLTETIGQRDKDIARLEHEKGQLKHSADRDRHLAHQAQKKLSAWACFNALPESLEEVVERIAAVHEGRIFFTERAKEAATKADWVDAGVAWNCLWEMATTLHDLYFKDGASSGNIEVEFRQRSKFELSLTEGKQTRDDDKLMKLRRDTYRGQVIDIEPHVKFGNKKPKMLRVYFCPHHADKLIVVGHCGEHLKVYSSQWQH